MELSFENFKFNHSKFCDDVHSDFYSLNNCPNGLGV